MNLTPANLTKRYGYWLADVILCDLLLTITFAEKRPSKSGADRRMANQIYIYPGRPRTLKNGLRKQPLIFENVKPPIFIFVKTAGTKFRFAGWSGSQFNSIKQPCFIFDFSLN